MKNLFKILLLAVAVGISVTGHAQFTPGQVLTAAELNAEFALKTTNTAAAITGGSISGLSSPLPIASGGTGASTGAGALGNLGAGTMASQNANAVNITGGTISGLGSPLPVASGGTGLTSLTNGFGLTALAQQANNTVLGNFTGSTANVTAFSMPSCSGTNSSLKYTSGAGFGCNSTTAILGANTFTATQQISDTTPLLVLNDTSGTSFGDVRYQSNGTLVWALRGNSSGTWGLNRYSAGVVVDSPIAVSPTTGVVTMLDGITSAGGINSTPIGATTPSTGAFTNLSATGTVSGISGRLLNIQTITSTGTYTPTSGTNKVLVYLVGGGGGGAGGIANASTQISNGTGGNGGALCIQLITSGFSGQTVTIGAGGTGTGTTLGNNGSNSTFMTMTAHGGSGGAGTQALFASANSIVGPQAITTSTGGFFNGATSAASTSVFLQGNAGIIGSIGGNSPLGGGGGTSALNGTAGAGSGAGAGGGGSASSPSAGPSSGGNGAAGIAIFYEYQ